MAASNPFFQLPYESALESLGETFYDRVQPATFPQPILRFRNDELLIQLGLDPKQVTDAHFLEAFGEFQASPHPCVGLALRYHGYQFGQYNPYLGMDEASSTVKCGLQPGNCWILALRAQVKRPIRKGEMDGCLCWGECEKFWQRKLSIV